MALERVIESRLGAAGPVTVAPTTSKGKVADLMEALKASIEATKKGESKTAKRGVQKTASPRSAKQSPVKATR